MEKHSCPADRAMDLAEAYREQSLSFRREVTVLTNKGTCHLCGAPTPELFCDEECHVEYIADVERKARLKANGHLK